MFKVLISDSVAKECVDILEAEDGIEVDYKTGLSIEEFNNIIGDYDALVVRSATKVREASIAFAKKLKVIGRAGAGVDNIDIPQATDAGIIVMNTPGGNTVSTAEHAFSLMMSLSRNVSQGDRSIKEKRWDPKKYIGVELRGKTVGIIGLGNIGRTFAQRAAAFEMTVLGYDPFISKEMASRYGIKLVTLDEMWPHVDYITLHTPHNDSTHHVVNKDTLAKCKDGVRVINCARGGVVNEADLLEAIESGKVAGAALDVYEIEPPVKNLLAMHEKVVCTPHLGASTLEAQEIVAAMIAEQVRDYLVKGEVRNAVNMPSMAPEDYELIKPYLILGSKMGSMLGQLGKGRLSQVEITYYGDIQTFDTWSISSSFLEGLLKHSYDDEVNLLNANSSAKKLGIEVKEIKSSEERDYKNCIEVKLKTDGINFEAVGTVFGKNNQRVVNLQGFNLEFVPDGNMIVCGNIDRPGLIGDIGTVLGKKSVNIGHMTWARKTVDGDAIVVLNTDEKADNDALDELKKIKNIQWAISISL